MAGAAVVVLLVVGWLRMESWQRDLLTSGRRTTGTVLRHETSGGRHTTYSITVAVEAERPFEATVDVGSFDRYAVGRTVDIWYDQDDTDRARTRWDSASDGSAEAMILGTIVSAWGGWAALLRIGYLRTVRVRVLAFDLTPVTVRRVGHERRSRRRDLVRVVVSDDPRSVFACSKRTARWLGGAGPVTASYDADVRLLWAGGRGALVHLVAVA